MPIEYEDQKNISRLVRSPMETDPSRCQQFVHIWNLPVPSHDAVCKTRTSPTTIVGFPSLRPPDSAEKVPASSVSKSRRIHSDALARSQPPWN